MFKQPRDWQAFLHCNFFYLHQRLDELETELSKSDSKLKKSVLTRNKINLTQVEPIHMILSQNNVNGSGISTHLFWKNVASWMMGRRPTILSWDVMQQTTESDIMISSAVSAKPPFHKLNGPKIAHHYWFISSRQVIALIGVEKWTPRWCNLNIFQPTFASCLVFFPQNS